MPCKAFLSQLRKAQDDIEAAGGQVIAVGTTSADQARRLMQRWVPFDCYLAPRGRIYRELGIPRFRAGDLLRPRFLGKFVVTYVKGFVQGVFQGVPSTTNQLPGVAVIDADLTLRYVHRGTAVGDYPPVEEVVDALRDVAHG